MTAEEIKAEIVLCLKAGPPNWSEVQKQLSPPCRWIVSAARGKRDVPDLMVEWKKKFPEVYATAGREIAVEAIDVLRAQIFGRRDWKDGQDKEIADAYPAAELVIARAEQTPAGWRERWTWAGGSEYDGRYVDLKTSSSWARFSEFGQPYEPFDWKLAFTREDVDRRAALAAGLIKSARPAGSGCSILIAIASLAAATAAWALTH